MTPRLLGVSPIMGLNCFVRFTDLPGSWPHLIFLLPNLGNTFEDGLALMPLHSWLCSYPRVRMLSFQTLVILDGSFADKRPFFDRKCGRPLTKKGILISVRLQTG